jgi:hypothetical protein
VLAALSWHHRVGNKPQVEATVSGRETVAAKASVGTAMVVARAYFSSFHLWSSRHARLVQGVEETGTADHLFPVRHRAYVIEAVTDAAFSWRLPSTRCSKTCSTVSRSSSAGWTTPRSSVGAENVNQA